jgi:hypothetical protein
VEPVFTTNEAKLKLAEIGRYQDLLLAIDSSSSQICELGAAGAWR